MKQKRQTILKTKYKELYPQDTNRIMLGGHKIKFQLSKSVANNKKLSSK